MLVYAVIIVVVMMAVLSNRLFSGLTSSVEEDQFKLMRSILESSLRSAEGRAVARAEMLANLPTLKQMFAARDRKRLLAEYGPMFRVQKEKHGVDQTQFHTPPAVSFLRLHSPKLYGDDLSSFRPMVVAVNQDRLARKGVAIARAGPAVFGVVPVQDAAGKHIGSLDVGIDFGSVLNNLKSDYDLEAALFIEEEPLRRFATAVSGEVLDKENRVGKYLKFHSTHWALMQGLMTSKDLAAIQEPVKYTREAMGVSYGVLLVPLRNDTGKSLGVIAVARDFSGSRAASRRSLVWQTLIALFAIVLLSGAVSVVLRGFLLRPLEALGNSFGALAKGEREMAIEDVDTLCEELQVLAHHHESLRTQQESASAQKPYSRASAQEKGDES
ncbi:MAG TPA: cache domain-containing protein [Abditibacteriaceae bacterium]|jgi:methyl-accepting chemotaxis protein